jgi:hypothetical protein
MSKIRDFKWLTEAESEQLPHELKQMWSTVPEDALARARQLAGVEAGKEHQFRVAAVPEQNGLFGLQFGKDGVPCAAQLPQPEIEIKFYLSEFNGDPLQKELHISVLAGGLPGTAVEGQLFESDDHAARWLQYILSDLAYQLPYALRTTILLSIEKSMYKARERFKLYNFDETERELSEQHLKILRKKASKTLQIRKGPRKGRKWSRVTRQQIDKLPEAIRQLDSEGEAASRPNVAKRIGIPGSSVARAKSLDRTLERYRPGETWPQIVERARKKGH